MDRAIALLGLMLWCSAGSAAGTELQAGALRLMWADHGFTEVQVAGEPLPEVRGRLMLLDPRTHQAAAPARFELRCDLHSRQGALWLEGAVTAAGTEDQVVDLVLRVDGVALPTGDGVTDMLLAPTLVNKQPLCPLRVLATGRDLLALAMPADAPYVCDFRDLAAERAVAMRLPLGLSNAAPPAFRLQAPFAIVLYATDPTWHYRAALAQYYRLFPERFRSVEKRHGGWFFANQVENIPNPQHYAYLEGQGSLDATHDRGLGMFPYNETGSETIQLPGPGLPKDYADAMRQMAALETAAAPAAWKLNGGALDAHVRRQGTYAYQASADRPQLTRHAAQVFLLKAPLAGRVVVSGWSKADGVVSHSGNPHDYSVYVDCLLADGSYQFGQCATFKAGSHDWEKSEWVIVPRAALVDMRVYAMFRNHTGTAWFDDLRLSPVERPDENLLENGDFEALGQRRDIQFVRDNALTDAAGQFRVLMTDNWGSDVRPTTPLSLLRFICNVDPDLRLPEDRLTPARRGTQFFDTLFAGNPGIDGCYIDGAGAWTCWYTSHRPDHFAGISHPLTYDPATFVVGQHGRLQMFKWLRALQDRYHPQGKTILGNMGPTLDAWTSYTALDIVGIESALFRDRARMAYHRFGSYHKPCLPMNFVNLHQLDDRPTAEEYVLASAQWGHLPSTGRLVREGYASYGDVSHAYYPALLEMSQAGWEPEPLALGVAAERFGGPRAAGMAPPGADRVSGAVTFAVRALPTGRHADLQILPAALAGIADPVVMDAVQLCPVPATCTPKGLLVALADGGEELTILRVSSAAGARRWLLERAAHHCGNAAIVRGRSENSDRLRALAQDCRALGLAGEERLAELRVRLRREMATVSAEKESLERTSLLTELQDAERAIAEWRLLSAGAVLTLRGETVVPVSQDATLAVELDPGTSQARLLACWAVPERNILRLHDVPVPAGAASGKPLVLRRALPGSAHVRSLVAVPLPGGEPVSVVRATNVHFTPVVTAGVERQVDAAAQAVVYTVTVQRLQGPMPLLVKASGPVPVEPAQVSLGADDTVAVFRVSARRTTTAVVHVEFAVTSSTERLLATASTEFRNLPVPPDGDLALASAGATVTADSSYSGYSPEVTIDGVWETSGLHWTKKAWASQDHAGEEGHWLEIVLPEPASVSQMWIYWAVDNNRVFSSVNYDIQVWSGDAWQTVAAVRGNPRSTVSQHRWPPTATRRVRLHQPRGGGPSERPNIFWISEICLFNRGTLN